MTEHYVRAQRMLLPSGFHAAALRIKGGRIDAVLAYDAVPKEAAVLDAGDAWVLPGIVDTHVHINDPGRSEWEGFESATRAAAAGGVTTLVDMPLNSIPATITAAALEAKVRAMEGRAFVDVGLSGGLVPDNAKHVADLLTAGALAVKCFMAESGVPEFSHVDEASLHTGMRALEHFNAPLLVHAELPEPLEQASRTQGQVSLSDARRYATYLASRPKTAEDAAVEQVIENGRKTGARSHIVHLSSATALPMLRRAKDEGLRLSAETCPHYLSLASEDIADGATAFKCAPPIREQANQEALWEGLREGVLDQIVTDHSPSTLNLKCNDSGDFMKAWGGISSLEIGLSVLALKAQTQRVTFESLVHKMTACPAKLMNLQGRKGTLVVGADADLAFWKSEESFEAKAATLHHKNAITPYEGKALKGRVIRTVLRGESIFWRDVAGAPHFAKPSGKWLRHSSL
jgi:allantoinase